MEQIKQNHSGQTILEHIVEADEMLSIGSGATRNISNYKLYANLSADTKRYHFKRF